MGGDGSGKYEIRYPNGTVMGNFTYINDIGERETRWYSAGSRGTEISGDGVISPAPPTIIDETTGANYVDLSNYDLYKHLEVPYVHIAGPSDPDERGQLSNPGNELRNFRNDNQQRQQVQQQFREVQQPRQEFREIQQHQQQAQVPLDFGDDTRFASQAQQEALAQQVRAPEPIRTSSRQRPSRVSRTRTPVQAASRSAAQFDPRAVDSSSPNHVLDSLIRQFQ